MELIDKAAVVAEIERKIEAHKETLKNTDSSISEMILKGSMSAYHSLLYFLDTIEVKDVDLKQEINKYIQDNIIGFCVPGTEETAKHFFELGLKAQKGE